MHEVSLLNLLVIMVGMCAVFEWVEKGLLFSLIIW
jgi:hypothetical protein